MSANAGTLDGAVMSDKTKSGFPSQIKYIIGNEAAERFSYYGMRSILVMFMVKYLMMAENQSKEIYHLFIGANYFMPLIGAYIADRYWGKYKTILYISLFYCLGHAALSIWENTFGLYLGLGLIAFGSGGIKPCVSAHVGDQFDSTNKHMIKKVYDLFYFSINFGSFFSTLLIPWLLKHYGPSVAFGVPGILMGLATLVFWMGRDLYRIVPPTGKENSARFIGVLWHGLTHLSEKKEGQSWLDTAREKFGEERVEGAKAVLGIISVFMFVIGFWSLFEQHGGSWVLQAEKMDRNVMGVLWESSQIPSLNPIMVMVLIPLFGYVIYPGIEKLGIKMTPLRRMGGGLAVTGLSFIWAGVLQSMLDAGTSVSVVHQIPPFLLLTAGEVMVSITGLEFAYTQAPKVMKSTVMSIWLLTVSIGNLFTAYIAHLNPFSGAMEFYFWAAFIFVLGAMFAVAATRYKERTYVG